jgi:hypothetical protein
MSDDTPQQPQPGWQPQPQPTDQATASPKGSRRWPWIVGIIAAFLVGLGIGLAANGGTDEDQTTAEQPVSTPPAAQSPTTLETDVQPAFHEPSKSDFDLTIKTISKECFGSAGCNITFRVKLAYDSSAGQLDPDKTYELTYKIRGGDEPLTNTLEITGEDYSTDQEEFIGTSSSTAKLTAVVTDVEEQ